MKLIEARELLGCQGRRQAWWIRDSGFLPDIREAIRVVRRTKSATRGDRAAADATEYVLSDSVRGK